MTPPQSADAIDAAVTAAHQALADACAQRVAQAVRLDEVNDDRRGHVVAPGQKRLKYSRACQVSESSAAA
jgi:hypothetical protein